MAIVVTGARNKRDGAFTVDVHNSSGGEREAVGRKKSLPQRFPSGLSEFPKHVPYYANSFQMQCRIKLMRNSGCEVHTPETWYRGLDSHDMASSQRQGGNSGSVLC